MDVFYDLAKLPPNRTIVDAVGAGTQRLSESLRRLDLGALGISEYNQKYLGEKLRALRSALQLNAHLLAWALHAAGKLPSEAVVLDYGGGSGLLSLQAKAIGVGTVVYSDIYDVSAADSQRVGKALGLEADAYVVGDTGDVVEAFRQRGLRCDAVVSYDVIEHIYDIDAFFRELAKLATGELAVVLGSGANDSNPVIRRQLMRLQRRVENTARDEVHGHKQRDTLRSYVSIRREMIVEHARSLGAAVAPGQVEELVSRTRGFAADDIKRAVERFHRSATLPPLPEHPTNTCDPRNGNWAEHLMTPRYLRGLMVRHGFKGEIAPGYWPTSGSRVKQLAVLGLNGAISALWGRGLALAPCYVVMAKCEGVRPTG